MQTELVSIDGGAQVALDDAPLAQPVVHFDFEETRLATAGGLGAVKRGVGIVEQRRGIGPVRREDRNADAETDAQILSVQIQIPGDGGMKLPGKHFGERGLISHRRDEDKFVAAEPGRDQDFFGERAQLFRQRAKQIVADRVPKRIVDFLEAVEVDTQDGERAIACRGGVDRAAKMLDKGEAIGQVRQGIMMGHMLDAGFHLPCAR